MIVMRRALFFLLIIFCISCKSEAPVELVEDSQEVVLEPSDEFLTFYDRFHADTVFQLDHIVFPLQGKPATGMFEGEVKEFKWTREGWTVHKAFKEDDDTFDRQFVVHAPELITEVIYSATYGFYMERRFAKLSDGWNLIYFADMAKKE